VKQPRFAISSYQATIFGLGCLPAIMLKREFERMRAKVPILSRVDKQFNLLIVQMARSTLNSRLIGDHLFDAVELHLTDPRMFYNPLEWKLNQRMIARVRAPISSFHAHMESNPLLKRYAFNMSDNSQKTRKAIKSQLKLAYEVLQKHPDLVRTENPVFVFHAGVAKNVDDIENALLRTRENIEYVVTANNELWHQYGAERKVIPTIENSAADKLFLCQTIEDWKRVIRGFEDEIKLTLDYGHVQTMRGEREKLLSELRQGNLGEHIVNLHLHYSPEIDNEIQHVHAALSSIPQSKVEDFQNDLRTILNSTRIRDQGYITLEVPSRDPLDYMPWVGPLLRHLSSMNELLKSTGIFDWSQYRGDFDDQLASLRMAEEIVETQFEQRSLTDIT
jgi:sugar phosphate isomerase/epimerase